jgi:hypothetical protein
MRSNRTVKISEKYIDLLDHFICVKNSYLFWKHLVPFTISSLLLLLLSIPKENLLLNLSNVLQKPDWIWIPAILLTIISIGVYVATVYVQVCKLYPCSRYDISRTLGTCLFYSITCTLMAYAVLLSALSRDITFGDLWACILLTALSLTGIGWSGPKSWVETVGISFPDYEYGRRLTKKLNQSLKKIQSIPISKKQDIQDFVNILEALRENIDNNLHLEPKWFRYNMSIITRSIDDLTKQTKNSFLLNSSSLATEQFAPACRKELAFQYSEFTSSLTRFQSVLNQLDAGLSKEENNEY